MNVTDKKSMLEQYMQDHGLKKEQVLFMGDDIPDYVAMKAVGYPQLRRMLHWRSGKLQCMLLQ
jgi:3-deoxy-D-manno-octulosonate 8-phosphate phosphatase KdsC-like HAD superfamily phosphatase